jgi:undecaprenyl-diphosphatase
MNQRMRAAAALVGILTFAAMAYPVMRGETLGFDAPVRALIHGWSFPTLTAAMRAITMLGSEYLLVPLAAILVWRWERQGKRRTAYVLVAGSLTAEAAAQILKTLIYRPRPEVFFGLPPAETYSFPSGHAFVPAAYFWLVARAVSAGWRWRAAAVAMAGLIGYSRVYLGYHYPSDVVAGWALAVVWAAVWTSVEDRRAASPA